MWACQQPWRVLNHKNGETEKYSPSAQNYSRIRRPDQIGRLAAAGSPGCIELAQSGHSQALAYHHRPNQTGPGGAEVKQSCRNCQWLGTNGRKSIRKGFSYPCLAHIPMPDLPDSITQAYMFKWPPARSWMEPDSGIDCPAWKRK